MRVVLWSACGVVAGGDAMAAMSWRDPLQGIHIIQLKFILVKLNKHNSAFTLQPKPIHRHIIITIRTQKSCKETILHSISYTIKKSVNCLKCVNSTIQYHSPLLLKVIHTHSLLIKCILYWILQLCSVWKPLTLSTSH